MWQGSSRETIPDMDHSTSTLPPICSRKFSFHKHSSDIISHGTIGSLCYTILLRVIPDGMPPFNPTFISELEEFS
jgi:hypothetical protein